MQGQQEAGAVARRLHEEVMGAYEHEAQDVRLRALQKGEESEE